MIPAGELRAPSFRNSNATAAQHEQIVRGFFLSERVSASRHRFLRGRRTRPPFAASGGFAFTED
jgi:hypothetical protein